MYQMIYISKASKPMMDGDLEDILLSCRRNNLVQKVTGMLLYADQHFIQVLEGREATVRELYEKIKKDDRHNDAEVVFQQTIESRDFPDWSMGFKKADDEESQQFQGLFSDDEFVIAPKGEENRAHQVLMEFRDRMNAPEES